MMTSNEEARDTMTHKDGAEDTEFSGDSQATPSDQLAELEHSVQDLKDQVIRRTAELDNMRRRHLQERETLILEGNRRLINDLLPTVDDLERTLEHASDAKDPMQQGIELVYKNFLKVLDRYGVKAMETLGEPFDPHKHDALMEEPRTDVAPGTITREIQKGYILNDSVLRHAKVFVAKEG